MVKEISHTDFGLKNFWHTFHNFILKNCLKWTKLLQNKQMRKQEFEGVFMLDVLSFVNVPSFQP